MARGNQRDFYEVLGVSRTSSVDEIKAAYRKAALKWHPDRSPENKHEAEVKFRECTEAYSVLSDAQKRQVYDTYGHAGLSGSGGVDFNSTVFQDFHDIFGDFFGFEDIFGGGRRGRSRTQRGADLRGSIRRRHDENQAASAGILRSLQWHRREKRNGSRGLPDLRRARAARLSTGILHYYPDMSGLPGRGTDCSRALSGMSGTGSLRAREDHRAAHSAGRRYRHAAARGRRRRAR